MSFDDWGDDGIAEIQQKENVSPDYSSTRTNDNPYHQNSSKKADNRDNTAVDDDWGDSPTTQNNNSTNDRQKYPKDTQRNTEDSWGNKPSDRSNDRQSGRDSGYSDNPYYSNYRKPSQDNQGGNENWDDRDRGTGPVHNNQWRNDRQSTDNNDMGGSERQANVYVPDLDDSGFDVFNQGNNVGGNFAQFKNIPINVSGPNAPTKVDSFEQSGLSEPVLKNIKRCNYSLPTPCQSYSIPTILARRDLICCAHTGSGKTAAFILPLLDLFTQDQATNATEDHPYKAFPKVLILSPTRELTIQTYHNFKKFASNLPIKAKMCYGGTTNKFQMDHLKNGCDFLIATVGRLLDLIRRNVISLVSTRYIVLDEADRMLDMGFFEEVQNILSMCVSRDKQTMMYSATFPKELQEIAYRFLAKDYIFIAIGKVGSVNPDISQKILQTDNMSKLQLIQEELSGLKKSKVLIFVKTKKTADFLAAKLSMSDFSATSIHGDRLQSQREQVLVEFFKGIRTILVATDVAARGLDIPNVDYVINYDMPMEIDVYIHRIGRTGRVGNCGKSITFVDTQFDRTLLPALVDILKGSDQEIPDWLNETTAAGAARISANHTSYIEKDIRNMDSPSKGKMISDNNQDMVVRSSKRVEGSDQYQEQPYNAQNTSNSNTAVCTGNDDDDWC